MEKKTERILIVGGVAGGASCAARLRRNCEDCEIHIFDRGPHVSFANCGLPYYVGDVIKEEAKLLVATPELFRDRFNIQVHTRSEVTAIDRTQRTIRVKDLASDTEREEGYDMLVLSPGAGPLRPPLPGIDLAGIFAIRTIPDSRRVREWLDARHAGEAVVVGGGFIGLEMAENLQRRGLSVTVLEAAPQVMPPLDAEMAGYVAERLRRSGVLLRLGDPVAGFKSVGNRLVVGTGSGAELPADVVILAIGVRPETALAREAGLPVGDSGGILVDERMCTVDPHILAVGDAVEVAHVPSGAHLVVPLAGPANRQGRVAADVISGRNARFRGVQATAVCGAFGLTIAMTGASVKALERAGISDYAAVWLHPGSHSGYYPGATPVHLKLVFRPSDGLVLGAQAVGESGVEKRIDVISMAIQMGAAVGDLAEAELCYAPQYGAAKDPVNVAGMIAGNICAGDLVLADWRETLSDELLVVDVREPAEFEEGHMEGAINVPLHELRRRRDELPADRPLLVTCGVGQRAYYAARLLKQSGFDVRFLSGGMTTHRALIEAGTQVRPITGAEVRG